MAEEHVVPFHVVGDDISGGWVLIEAGPFVVEIPGLHVMNLEVETQRSMLDAIGETELEIQRKDLVVRPTFFGVESLELPTYVREDETHLEGRVARLEMRAYIGKIVDKEAFDHKGLVYGMGHAVYSLSDPRAVVFKSFVQQLAMAKGRKADFDFYNTVERLAPQVIAEKRHIYKGVSTNVDFYSGFVYNMLGIPVELYTPMFAVARVVGWSAHRMEELVNVDKIIRPAYKSVMATRDYLPMENRG